MASIDIITPEAEIARLHELLDPKQFAQALRSIVTKTSSHMKTTVSTAVRDRINMRKAYLDKNLLSVRISSDGLTGRVALKGKMVPLYAYKGVKETPGNGVSIDIKTDTGNHAYRLRHAFLATVRSESQARQGIEGHTGAYMRSRHIPSEGPNVGKLDRWGQPYYKLTPQGYAGRLSIIELLGPPLTKLINAPEVLGGIKSDGGEFMKRQALSQFSRFGLAPMGDGGGNAE